MRHKRGRTRRFWHSGRTRRFWHSQKRRYPPQAQTHVPKPTGGPVVTGTPNRPVTFYGGSLRGASLTSPVVDLELKFTAAASYQLPLYALVKKDHPAGVALKILNAFCSYVYGTASARVSQVRGVIFRLSGSRGGKASSSSGGGPSDYSSCLSSAYPARAESS